VPRDDAYRLAIAQFRELRAQHEVATRAAVREAEAYGTVFADTVVERGLALEARAFDSWKDAPALVQPTTDRSGRPLTGENRDQPAFLVPLSSASGKDKALTGREVLEGFQAPTAPQPFTAGTAYLSQPLPQRSRKQPAAEVQASRSDESQDGPIPFVNAAVEMLRAEREAQPPPPTKPAKPSQTRSTRQRARPLKS